MSPLIWILMGLVLGVVELLSTTFVLLWLAIAAVVTGLLGFILPEFMTQVIVFALLSGILIFITRPLAKKWRNGKSKYVSNIEHLVGEKGVVISKIAEGGKTGMVRVGSEVWSARSEQISQEVEVGAFVEVTGVRSALLIVRKIP